MCVTLQVLKFVVSHQEVFCGVLRSVNQLTADQLTELALVTGVVGRAALSGTLDSQRYSKLAFHMLKTPLVSS